MFAVFRCAVITVELFTQLFHFFAMQNDGIFTGDIFILYAQGKF